MYTVRWFTGYAIDEDGKEYGTNYEYTVIANSKSVHEMIFLIKASIKGREKARIDIYLNGLVVFTDRYSENKNV